MWLKLFFQNFLFLADLHKWLFVVILYFSLQAQIHCTQIFTGHSCTSGGYAIVPGECKLLTDCPSALSNFRAGVSPSVCYQENEIPLVCCQTEQRISAKKCDEYSKQVFEQQAKSNIPGFAPFYAAGNYEDSSRYGNGAASFGVCNHTNAQPFISGRRPADRHEMSFAVAIGYEESGKGIAWKCGGTLISEQFVLTAAHCLDGKVRYFLYSCSKAPSHVLLGDKHLEKLDTFSSSHRIEAEIEKIIIHPEYKRPVKYHDIGLIKLDRKVKFSRMVQPACLPRPEQRPETLSELLIAGWGRLEYFGKRGDVLQVVNITRYNVKECNKAYEGGLELPDGIIKFQVCAGDMEGNKDTCDGDSGGPLVSKHDKATCMQTIIGLTSFGDQFCGSGIPAVYTNVQSYLDWIESEVWTSYK